MIQYIKSETYRKFLKDNDIVLSPLDKGTMIANADACMKDKISSLKELVRETADEVLETEADRLIDDWNEKSRKFSTGTDNTAYKLIVGMDDCQRYYKDLETAEIVGKQSSKDFKIEMIQIYRSLSDVQRIAEGSDVVKDCISGAFYSEEGKLLDVWENSFVKHPDKEKMMLDERYIGLRHPFYKGTFVKITGSEKYGISNDFKDASGQMEAIEKNRKEGWADYVDDSVMVEFLMEDGHFSHDHINPAYLDLVEEDNLPAGIRRLFREASYLLTGKGSIESFQYYLNVFLDKE